MTRRLIVFAVLIGVAGGGLATAASASMPTTRHKVCVANDKLLPNGLCVVWDDPAPVVPQQ